MVERTASDPSFEQKVSAGAIISAERKQQGLSLSDVARQLKLSPRQIEALERDDFAMFRGALFVHGFLRNYARLLKIDPAPLIQAANEILNPAPAVTPEQAPISVARPPEASNGAAELPRQTDAGADTLAEPHETARYPSRLLTLAAVALVVIAVGYAVRHQEVRPTTSQPETRGAKSAGKSDRAEGANKYAKGGASQRQDVDVRRLKDQKAVQSRPAEVTPAPVTTGQSEFEKPVTRDSTTVGESISGRENEANSSTPKNAGEDTQASTDTADVLTLHMVFEQESWVEIKDVTGKTIFAQLNAAGSERSFTGNSPLSVVVGNANGVRLSINDQPVSLEPHTLVNVARVTLP